MVLLYVRALYVLIGDASNTATANIYHLSIGLCVLFAYLHICICMVAGNTRHRKPHL